MFKTISASDISYNKSFDIISYQIGDGLSNFYLSANVKGYIFTKNDNFSLPTFNSLKNFYYSDQTDSTSAYIIPTSYITNHVGSNTSNTIVVFTFDKNLTKDSISTEKSERNIEIYLNSLIYDINNNLNYSLGINNTNKINYILYDKPHSITGSITSGDIKLQISDNISLSSATSYFLNIGNINVGKIFYDKGIIILDSLSALNIKQLNISNYIYSIPYPIANSDISGNKYSITYNALSSGNINYINNAISGFNFNINSTTTITSSITSIISNSFLIDKINVDFKIYKQSYTYNLLIDFDEFNYSTNQALISQSNNLPFIATDENPIYFTKIGFYDIYNNLIAIGKVSMPIKLSKDRQIKLKFKLDV